jgi:hypothetical protein
MKPIAVAVLSLSAVLTPLGARSQVTSNVFERVLSVRVNAGTDHEGTATAFTLDVDGREYLITAKHVVQGLMDKDKIDVFVHDGWSPITVEIFCCEDPVDIAVLVPPRQLTVNYDLPFDKTRITFGQDTFFLGFPYGIMPSGRGVNGVYPLAVVKKGTFSGQLVLDSAKKATMLLLDGYNNPGFSGGPIVYHDANEGGYALKLAGVVSGFIPEVVPDMKEHDIASPAEAGKAAKAQPWRIRRRSNGTYFEYVDSGTFVALNTGIVQGFFIDPAIDLIRQHPIGPEAKERQVNDPGQ